jgi:hypothetical protein
MSDTTNDAVEQGIAAELEPDSSPGEPEVSFSERYSDILSKVNATLDKVDWSQMGRIGKATGVIVAVIVAQILIKGVLDTINLLPVVPGLLELLGLVVVGQWSWHNLTTSEKRGAVVDKVQNLRKEYLG